MSVHFRVYLVWIVILWVHVQGKKAVGAICWIMVVFPPLWTKDGGCGHLWVLVSSKISFSEKWSCYIFLKLKFNVVSESHWKGDFMMRILPNLLFISIRNFEIGLGYAYYYTSCISKTLLCRSFSCKYQHFLYNTITLINI